MVICMYICSYMLIYIYIYIYTNLPVNAIVRQHHPQSGDSRGQKKFIPPSADKQTRNFNTRVLKLPSLSINPNVRRIEPQQDEMMSHIYTNLPVNAIVRQHHPRSGDSQGQETFLEPSADKQTRKYDTRVLKPPSIPINSKVRQIEP